MPVLLPHHAVTRATNDFHRSTLMSPRLDLLWILTSHRTCPMTWPLFRTWFDIILYRRRKAGLNDMALWRWEFSEIYNTFPFNVQQSKPLGEVWTRGKGWGAETSIDGSYVWAHMTPKNGSWSHQSSHITGFITGEMTQTVWIYDNRFQVWQSSKITMHCLRQPQKSSASERDDPSGRNRCRGLCSNEELSRSGPNEETWLDSAGKVDWRSEKQLKYASNACCPEPHKAPLDGSWRMEKFRRRRQLRTSDSDGTRSTNNIMSSKVFYFLFCWFRTFVTWLVFKPNMFNIWG